MLRLLVVTSSLQSSQLTDLQDHLEECRAEESWAEYSDCVISFFTSHFPATWERRDLISQIHVLVQSPPLIQTSQKLRMLSRSQSVY